jgi:CelD/BcsL family acetyltransferase involved in cellulose biosynthesis
MDTNIQVINTLEGFETLRNDWDKLLRRTEQVNVFSSWEWQYHWWRNYGKHRALRLLVAKNKTNVVGILPLYAQSINFLQFIPLSVLRLIGTGGDTSPDYLGPLLEPGKEQEICLALCEFILHEMTTWDVLNFTDIPQAGTFAMALSDMCMREGQAFDNSAISVIPVIRLPATWEDYLSKLHRDKRYRVRKLRRKLTEAFSVNFHVWDSKEKLDEVIDQLIRLHHLRWQNSKQSDSFASPEYVGFHRDAIKSCFDRDWIRLYCLTLNDQMAAIYYCYRFNNEVLYFQSGFDPAFEDFVPGQVLLGFAVEHAINEGNKVFDLLKGQHRYKTEWANDSRKTCDLSVYRGNFRAQAYFTRTQRLPRLKATVKTMLRSIGLGKTP